MKNFLALSLCLALSACSACGLSSENNELSGQVKKATQQSRLFCPDQNLVDISLGIMRNGMGSPSKEDVELVVPDLAVFQALKVEAQRGGLVSVLYNERRVVWCDPSLILVSFNVLGEDGKFPALNKVEAK
jgi:hypothetical protein